MATTYPLICLPTTSISVLSAGLIVGSRFLDTKSTETRKFSSSFSALSAVSWVTKSWDSGSRRNDCLVEGRLGNRVAVLVVALEDGRVDEGRTDDALEDGLTDALVDGLTEDALDDGRTDALEGGRVDALEDGRVDMLEAGLRPGMGSREPEGFICIERF